MNIAKKLISTPLTLILVMILLFISAGACAAQDSFIVSADKGDISLCQWDIIEGQITLSNTGSEPLAVTISKEGSGAGYVSLDEDFVAIGPGETRVLKEFINAPQAGAEQGILGISIIFTGSNGEKKVLEQRIRLGACSNIMLTGKGISQAGCAGIPIEYVFEITNTGPYAEAYEISLSKYSEFASITQDFFVLDASQTKEVRLFLNFPLYDYKVYKAYLRVTALNSRMYAELPLTSDIRDCSVVITPTEPTPAPQPPVYSAFIVNDFLSAGYRNSSKAMKVLNNGTADAVFTFSVIGPSWVNVKYSPLGVEAGEKGRFYALLTPSESDKEGTYNATFNVYMNNTRLLHSKTINVQLSRRSPLLVLLLLLMMALLLVILLIVIFAFKKVQGKKAEEVQPIKEEVEGPEVPKPYYKEISPEKTERKYEPRKKALFESRKKKPASLKWLWILLIIILLIAFVLAEMYLVQRLKPESPINETYEENETNITAPEPVNETEKEEEESNLTEEPGVFSVLWDKLVCWFEREEYESPLNETYEAANVTEANETNITQEEIPEEAAEANAVNAEEQERRRDVEDALAEMDENETEGSFFYQVWEQDTTKTIDLSEYFYDEDNNILYYSSTMPDNISADIEGNIVTLTPAEGWFGVNYIEFYASDGEYSTSSGNVTLVVKPATGNAFAGTKEFFRQYWVYFVIGIVLLLVIIAGIRFLDTREE